MILRCIVQTPGGETYGSSDFVKRSGLLLTVKKAILSTERN
jgi:hypothetical protein